ncbi:MAG: hypothetical protein ACYTBJ_18515 [Planctomycetota bacterium]|jgi:hypothetical protein
MSLKTALNKVNEDLQYYQVTHVTAENNVPVICEDGEYRKRAGYSVYNTLSGVHEHTTTLLPGAIFQAQHLDATLDGLINPKMQEYPALEDVAMDDVVAN